MDQRTMKLLSAGCVLLGFILMLFLPFVSVILVGIGLNGIKMFQISLLMILPLIASVVMIGAALGLQNKAAGTAILAVGAFIPLICEEIIEGQCASVIMGLLGETAAAVTGLASVVLSPGLGVILYLVLSLVAAVLFFMSESAAFGRKKHGTTPGIGMDDGNW